MYQPAECPGGAPLSPIERSQEQSRGAASDHQIGAIANHRLTATTGLVLVPLLGLVFLTGLAMDAYWHVHYVIGFVLIPMIALKLATTGYRAARYYTGSAAYRALGPPQIGLRLLAPLLVVALTVALVTGVALFAAHGRTGTLSTLHTDSAVISAGLVGIHFLAYLSDATRTTLSELRRHAPKGRSLRWILVLVALGVGAAVAGLTYSGGVWPARSRPDERGDHSTPGIAQTPQPSRVESAALLTRHW